MTIDLDHPRYHEAAETMRSQARDAESVAHTIDGRLSTWLLVANAGALLLCLNALTDQKVCDWGAVQRLLLFFIFGMACAFNSALVDSGVKWGTVGIFERGARAAAGAHRLGKIYSTVAKEAAELEKRSPDDLQARIRSSDLVQQMGRLTTEAEELLKKATAAEDSAERVKRRTRIVGWLQIASIVAFGLGLTFAIYHPQYAKALCSPPQAATRSANALSGEFAAISARASGGQTLFPHMRPWAVRLSGVRRRVGQSHRNRESPARGTARAG